MDEHSQEQMQRDARGFRVAVVVLGLGVLASIAGVVVLALQGRSIPEWLVALGSAAVGGLSCLRSPQREGW